MSNTDAEYETNWVEVDITILEGKLLQILQCHVRSLFHRFQVFLAIKYRKIHTGDICGIYFTFRF